MIYAYEVMLDAGNDENRYFVTKTFLHREVVKYFIQTLPHIVFFTYAMSRIFTADAGRGLTGYGSIWIHFTILLAAAVLLVINVILERKRFRIGDVYPAEV